MGVVPIVSKRPAPHVGDDIVRHSEQSEKRLAVCFMDPL